MVRSFTALATVAAAATLLSVADAHSNMVAPAPKWPDGFYNGNSPVGTVDSRAFTGGGKGMGADGSSKKLTAEMAGADLRTFIMSRVKMDMAGATKECGKTLLTGTPYPLPAEVDFPWGHGGPCAGYCDDVKFFQNEDCQANKVGKLKVDQAKCANAKRLQVMYLGTHVEDYQYYVNCVPLTGSGAGGGGGGGAAPAPAPAAGGNGGGNTGGEAAAPNPAPAPANPAPAPAPAPANPAPAPTKACKRRLRN